MIYDSCNNLPIKFFIEVTEVVFRGNTVKVADNKTQIDPFCILAFKNYDNYTALYFNGFIINVKETKDEIVKKTYELINKAFNNSKDLQTRFKAFD